MRHIVFVFKESAGLLNYKAAADSMLNKDFLVNMDVRTLKNTTFPGPLYLLGQNDDYFFVLFQPAKIPGIKALPIGNVYFVNKNDVLYTKIGITLNQ
jgi:hypothetical protein